MTWQKWARLLIAVGAVAFAVIVALGFRKGAPASAGRVSTSDPKAVIESSKGTHDRSSKSHDDVNIQFDHLTSYEDGSSKAERILVTTTRANGRQFTISANEAMVAKNETEFVFTGNVRVEVSDGMLVHTEHATYSDKDGMVRSASPVDIARGRMTGSAVGLTYDKTREALMLLADVQLHMAPDQHGNGKMEIAAPGATFDRLDKTVHFETGIHATRGTQVIVADGAIVHLSEDEERLQSMDLHGNAKITGEDGGVGGLRGLSGQSVNLQYGPDGESIQHAVVVGDASIQLASEQGHPGRQIGANSVDMMLAADGSTPTAVTANDRVQLTFPADQGVPARAITADHLVGRGDERRGLTAAHFDGNVVFREQGADLDRRARSQLLDVSLGPGMSSIDEARFSRVVRFDDGGMTATAATARYVLDKGTLDLASVEPGSAAPHVDTQQIAVDAPKIAIILAGPVVSAASPVKSVLKRQPPDAGREGQPATKTPAMLKKDQDVIVTADSLDYDGNTSQANYTGNVYLTQGDTTIKAVSMVVDNESGDLTAAGEESKPVMTSVVREEPDDNGKLERRRSDAKANDLKYEDDSRKLIYTGAAHMFGPAGDLTADEIDLFLKPSGDEVDRVEAFIKITMKESSGRVTTGDRLTYTSAGEQYLVVGKPVHVTEACGRTTTGSTLKLFKATDTITVESNDASRSQTVGSNSNCP